MFQLLVGIYLIKVFYLGQSVLFCTFLKTLILLSLVVNSKIMCVMGNWNQIKPSYSKCTIKANFHQNTKHLTLLPHLHETLVSFAPSSTFVPVPLHWAQKIPEHASQSQWNATTWCCLCQSFPCHEYESLQVSSQNGMALQFGLCIQTIHVCTIFSPRNYPSSVQLVHSLLSWLE